MGGGCQGSLLVVEPRHSRRIVAGAEIAAGVGGLDPVAAEGVLAPHQRSDASEIIGDRRNRQAPARGVEAAKIAMASARAENMPSDEEPGSFHKSAVEGVAQIDGRPF